MNTYSRIIFCLFLFLLTPFLFLPRAGLALGAVPYAVQCTWIENNENNILCVSLEPQNSYYTYAPLQENTYPTEISLTEIPLSENYLPGKLPEIPVLYPLGTWKEDVNLKQKIRVFEGTTRIYLLFPQKYAGSIGISLLACSGEHCLPFKTQINVSSAPSLYLQNFPYKNELDTLLSAYLRHSLAREQLAFAAFQQTKKQNFAVQTAISGETGEQEIEAYSLAKLKERAEQKNSRTVLDQETAQEQKTDFSMFSPRPFYRELEVQSLAKALFFGVLAGFILNFMPCVLPVVALKLHALLGTAADRGKVFFREQMLFFALGILAWFVVLAVLFGGLGLTWGQLFQEYWLMLFLCILVFVLALSLFDVFHLPVINLRNRLHSQGQHVRLDTFLSGFLATVLATPCSGPLLGGVLGFVLTQSFGIIVLVFVCMGLGMALPYLVFACKPGFVSFMPKAGNWLLVLEKILAFFLLGTALYLFSLLPDFLHIKVLCFLLLLCICLYIWGKWASMQLAKKQRLLVFSGLCLCVLLCFWFLFVRAVPEKENFSWQEFQTQKFIQSLGHKTLLVKFTADWCPTCKVLEQTVFTEKNMQDLFSQSHGEILFMLVDMTQFDEEKQTLLTSLGSASIPFLAVFPKNNPRHPYIVRDIYTISTVRQVLKKAVEEENAGE